VLLHFLKSESNYRSFNYFENSIIPTPQTLGLNPGFGMWERFLISGYSKIENKELTLVFKDVVVT